MDLKITENFDVFRKLTEKYKNKRVSLTLILLGFDLSLPINAMFGFYALYIPAVIYFVIFIISLFTDSKTFQSVCLLINFVVFLGFIYFFDFLTIVVGLGIPLLIISYFQIQIIRYDNVKKILKKIHGYPIFNLSITSKEIQTDSELQNEIFSEIEIALSEKSFAKESVSVKRKKVKKVFIVLNCVFTVVFISSFVLLNYAANLQRNITNAKDFETAQQSKNVYVKGKIDEIVFGAVGGGIRQYWFKFRGEYLALEVTENFQAYDNFLDKDKTNDKEIEFVGKYIIADYLNIPALELYLKDSNIKYDISEVNDIYILKVINADGYKIFYKIGYILLLISLIYFLINLFTMFLFSVKNGRG
jgi:hypothetical protein